jgi:hypothetical protein
MYVAPDPTITRPPVQGELRVIGTDIQVFSNSAWTPMGGTIPQVNLDSMAMSAITWASAQMLREDEWNRLAKKNITIQDALDQHNKLVSEAREKLMVVVALASK